MEFAAVGNLRTVVVVVVVVVVAVVAVAWVGGHVVVAGVVAVEAVGTEPVGTLQAVAVGGYYIVAAVVVHRTAAADGGVEVRRTVGAAEVVAAQYIHVVDTAADVADVVEVVVGTRRIAVAVVEHKLAVVVALDE